MPTNNSINTDTNSFCVTFNNLSDVSNAAQANLNLFDQNSITGTITLTSIAYGQVQVCSGSSSYTITLPSPIANQYIDFEFIQMSNAIIDIVPASGTIDGQTGLSYVNSEGCRLYCDGTNFYTMWEKFQPVSFNASLSTLFPLSTGAEITVIYDQVNANVGGFYDNTTGIFQPLIPGQYLLQTSNNYDSPSFLPGEQAIVALDFNDGAQLVGADFRYIVVSDPGILQTSFVQYFNGTTDHVVSISEQGNASTQNLSTTQGVCYFSAIRISRY